MRRAIRWDLVAGLLAVLAFLSIFANIANKGATDVYGPREVFFYEYGFDGYPSRDGVADITEVVVSVAAAPGDLVYLPWMGGSQGWEDIEIYVTEGGEARGIALGEPPRHVYLHAKLDEPYPRSLVRPAAEKTVENTPSYTTRGELMLDVAWVARRGEPRSDETARADTIKSIYESARHDTFGCCPVVVEPSVLARQPYFDAATIALCVATLAALGGSIVAGRRREPVPPPQPDVADAVQLAERAGSYLVELRDFLRIVGVLGVLSLTASFLAMGLMSRSASEALYVVEWGIDWEDGLMLAMGVVDLVLVALWLRYYLKLRNEIRRWRRASEQRPLGL